MFLIRQPATPQELDAGLTLLNETFEDYFGAYPRELPHEFFVAIEQDTGRVVGTINLQHSRIRNPVFEVEHFFHCSVNDFYPLGCREDVGEIGRLTSKRYEITPYLFCAVALFAIKVGIEFFVSFNKRKITKLMRASLQFPVNEYRCLLRRENVKLEYEPYFCQEEDPVVVLTHPVANWERRVSQLLAEANGTMKIEVPDQIGQMESLILDRLARFPMESNLSVKP